MPDQSKLIEDTPNLIKKIPAELKLMSWNVNGIRAGFKKGFADFLAEESPDILGVQEIKARPDQLTKEQLYPHDYASFWNPAERPGYSGTALYSKYGLKNVTTIFPAGVLNGEGRVISADIGDITFLNIYFPNGKRDHARLKFKLDFYDEFLKHIEKLRKKGRKIVFCGDVNTAHKEIDLSRPKENEKTSGFLPEERAWIDKLIDMGYIDTLRLFKPDETEIFTWWDVITRARDRNVGWRIDYFFVSPDLKKRIIKANTHPEIMGSDHCPVSLNLKMT